MFCKVSIKYKIYSDIKKFDTDKIFVYLVEILLWIDRASRSICRRKEELYSEINEK